jgi:hypothetical protein
MGPEMGPPCGPVFLGKGAVTALFRVAVMWVFTNRCCEYMRHISSKAMLVPGALAMGADRCDPTVVQLAEALGGQTVISKFSCSAAWGHMLPKGCGRWKPPWGKAANELF